MTEASRNTHISYILPVFDSYCLLQYVPKSGGHGYFRLPLYFKGIDEIQREKYLGTRHGFFHVSKDISLWVTDLYINDLHEYLSGMPNLHAYDTKLLLHECVGHDAHSATHISQTLQNIISHLYHSPNQLNQLISQLNADDSHYNVSGDANKYIMFSNMWNELKQIRKKNPQLINKVIELVTDIVDLPNGYFKLKGKHPSFLTYPTHYNPKRNHLDHWFFHFLDYQIK